MLVVIDNLPQLAPARQIYLNLYLTDKGKSFFMFKGADIVLWIAWKLIIFHWKFFVNL